MNQYDDNMRGVLFAHERENDKQPVMKGHCVINGEKLYISVWGNTSAKGTKYWSMQFEQPREERGQPTPPPKRKDDFIDDMPF